MTAFQIDASSADRGILRVANLPDLLAKPIRDEALEVAKLVRLDAISTIQRRGVSFVGPPARVTGALIASLRAKAKSRSGDIRAYVTAVQPPKDRYAFMLESGTGRSRRAPFLVPAARRHTQEFVTRIEQAINKAIRQSTSP